MGLRCVEDFLAHEATHVRHVEFVLWGHVAWAAFTEAALDAGIVKG